MSFYAISLQPLITRLNLSSNAKQCSYADDVTGAGSLEELRKWWDELNEMGPSLGYFPNAKKCWLVIKPEREKAAREVFGDTAINISTLGQKHLGAVLGLIWKVYEWKGGGLGRASRQARRIRREKCTNLVCCFCIRVETSMDVLLKKVA